MVGHLKYIVTVRRKACCRLQHESEYLICNSLARCSRILTVHDFLLAIEDSRDACASALGIGRATVFTISS